MDSSSVAGNEVAAVEVVNPPNERDKPPQELALPLAPLSALPLRPFAVALAPALALELPEAEPLSVDTGSFCASVVLLEGKPDMAAFNDRVFCSASDSKRAFFTSSSSSKQDR